MAAAVIAGREDIAAMTASAEETTFLMLAEPPVATDLCATLNATRIATGSESMGELAVCGR